MRLGPTFISAACSLHNLLLNVYPDEQFDLTIDDLRSDDKDDASDDEEWRDDGDGHEHGSQVPANQRRRDEVCTKMLELMSDD